MRTLIGTVAALLGLAPLAHAQWNDPEWSDARTLADVRALDPGTTAVHATGFTDAHVELLLRLERLEWLKLSKSPEVTPAALGKLARLPKLAHFVADEGGQDSWLAAVATWPALYDVGGYYREGVSPAALEALAAAPRLAWLKVGGHYDARACAIVARIRGLTWLHLSLNGDADALLSTLAACQKLSRLTCYATPGLTDAGVATVAGLPRLRDVWLGECERTTDAALGHLARAKQLRSIHLGNAAHFSLAGIEQLAALPELTSLGFSDRPFTDEQAQVFARIRTLQQIFTLRGRPLTDAGAAALASLPDLRTVQIASDNQPGDGSIGITDAGVAQFEQCAKLTLFSLGRADHVSPAAVRRLEKALPGCKVTIIPGLPDPNPPAPSQPVEGFPPYEEFQVRLREVTAPAELADVRGLTAIRLRTYQAKEPPTPAEAAADAGELAWLVSETDDTLTVVDDDLQRTAIEKDPRRAGTAEGPPGVLPAPAEDGQWDAHPWYRRVDFAAEVEARIAAADERSYYQRQELITLACACEQLGRRDLAAKCYYLACRSARAEDAQQHWGQQKPWTAERLLQQWAWLRGAWLMNEIMTGLAEGKDRRAMAALADRAEKLSLGEWRRDEEGGLPGMLRAMAAEEDARAAEARPALTSLPPAARTEELVYRLRDVRAAAPEFWRHEDDTPKTPTDPDHPDPVQGLVAIGQPAVPALIERLDDARPTRWLAEQRGSMPAPPRVLRYCDLAERVLIRIVGRDVRKRRADEYGLPGRVADLQDAKREWLAWWAAQAGKSLQDLWFTDLESPDVRVRATAITRLIPGSGFADWPALAKAIASLDEPGPLLQVAEALGKAPDPFRREQLLRLARHDRVQVSVAAARRMRDCEFEDDPAAVVAHLRARLAAGPVADPGFTRGLPPDIAKMMQAQRGAAWGPFEIEGAAELFIAMATPAAIACLDWMAEHLDMGARHAVIQTLGRSEWAGAEPILVEALSVRAGRRTGGGGIAGGGEFRNPRLCDVAAIALSVRWKVADRYRWTGGDSERDRQIREIENLWRRKQGLPPLPALEAPAVDRARLDAVVQRHAAADGDHPPAVLAELRALGVGAGPALLAMAAAAEGDARERLRELAAHCVRTVRAVRVAGEAAEARRDALLALLSKPGEALDPACVRPLVQRHFLDDDTIVGIQVRIEMSVETGARLVVALETGTPSGARYINMGHGGSVSSSIPTIAPEECEKFLREMVDGGDPAFMDGEDVLERTIDQTWWARR